MIYTAKLTGAFEKAVSQEDKREWGGYKLATLLVSISSVLVIGAQALYNNFYVQRWKRTEYLAAELGRKREQLERQAATPRIALNVNTLEKAGLSSQLLSSLSAVPSTVEIQNVGGGTAKGLLLNIFSTEQITQYQKWPSLEQFLVTRAGAEGKTLRVQSAQIRKGSTIGLTLLTRKLPKLETKVLLDSGEIASQEQPRRSRLSRLYSLPTDVLSRLSADEFENFEKETNSLKLEVMTLEKQVENSQSESIWDSVSISLIIACLSIIVVFGSSAVMVIRSLRGDHLKRSRMNKTIQDIRSKTFRLRTLTEVLRDLGTPEQCNVFGEGDTPDVELIYFSKYEWRSSTNGLRLRFHDHKLLKVEDESGYTILSQ